MKMKRRNQIKKKEIGLIFLLVVISLFISSIQTYAAAQENEFEGMDNINVQPSPDQHSQKQKQHTDPFTMAIIGISFGCMMIASSLHWNMTQRKELETQINTLDSFLESTCAVQCNIKGCHGDDQMMDAVEDIKKRRDEKIEGYQNHKDIAVRSISDIENEIMRIWG
jgi:hypothetical protein